MKALLQRVSEARVVVEGETISKIGKGLLVLLGVEKGDSESDLEYVVRKVSGLRIFEDADGKMNLSIRDIEGEVLVVSQFTLAADCRKGTRPSFDRAEDPVRANEIYTRTVRRLREEVVRVLTGKFGAYMSVHLINDGPVTVMLDSQK